jgi:hypothetical protein
MHLVGKIPGPEKVKEPILVNVKKRERAVRSIEHIT